MNKRLQTIQVMKEKLYNIQGQLNNIAHKENVEPLKCKELCKTLQTHSSLQYKNPTYWSGNPILGTQVMYRKTPQKPILSKNQRSQSKSHKQLNPRLKEIMQETTNQYYQSKPIQKSYSRSSNSKKKYSSNTQQFFSSKTPRFTHIKTYKQQSRNPITNPPKQPATGRKICKMKQKSPENFYTQNPKSSPLIYFKKTQAIYLSPLSNRVSLKNNSSNIDRILNHSNEHEDHTSVQKVSTGKRHFSRYIHQDLGFR